MAKTTSGFLLDSKYTELENTGEGAGVRRVWPLSPPQVSSREPDLGVWRAQEGLSPRV